MTMTDYEKEVAQRREEERKQTKAFHAKLRLVAPLVGGTLVDPNPNNDHAAGNISLPFGGVIYINRDWRGNSRWNISGNWPRDAKGETHSPHFSAYSASPKDPAISVSGERTPEAIAREITRRFIPAYQALYEAQLQRANDSDDYERTTRGNLRKLALILGVSVSDNYSGNRTGDDHGDFEVSRDDVKVTLRLPMKQAERIARLVATLPKEDGQ